jgi:hypothetical protein
MRRGTPADRLLARNRLTDDTSAMSNNGEERRYTEEEFALILKRAIELDTRRSSLPQRAPAPPLLPPGGLTLREIQEIAAEVGVNPVRVAEAADSLAVSKWSPQAKLFGGPSKMSAHRSLARLLPPEDMGRLLDVPRRLLKTDGEAHEVLGGVEWKNSSMVKTVSVRVSPDGRGARLNVSVDRGGEAFLSHYVPILWGLGIAGIAVGVLDPETTEAIVGIVAAGAASGYAAARTIWAKSTKRWQQLLRRMTSEIGELAEPDPAEEDTSAGRA